MDLGDYIWNAIQQIQIQNTDGRIRDIKYEAGEEARQTAERVYIPVFKEVERLKLVCQALWTLLQDKTGLTDEELIERVIQLDLRDGARDGKYQKPPIDCPKCGAKMCRKFNRCLFCGEPCTDATAFDSVTPD